MNMYDAPIWTVEMRISQETLSTYRIPVIRLIVREFTVLPVSLSGYSVTHITTMQACRNLNLTWYTHKIIILKKRQNLTLTQFRVRIRLAKTAHCQDKTVTFNKGHRYLGDLSNATCFTNSQSIIEATVAGNGCIKRVNVNNIANKSEDLKLCLQQQNNPLGFLPINNLSYGSRNLSLAPKVIISDPNLTLSKFIDWLEIQDSTYLKGQESYFLRKLIFHFLKVWFKGIGTGSYHFSLNMDFFWIFLMQRKLILNMVKVIIHQQTIFLFMSISI